MVVEERGDGLVFELGDGGVGPVEDGEPGDVGEGHDAAGVRLAGDSDGYGELVGEAVLLHVAGGAGAFTVDGHAEVVEEVAAQLDFSGGHRVVGGDGWGVEAGRQVPVERGCLVEGESADGTEDCGEDCCGASFCWIPP